MSFSLPSGVWQSAGLASIYCANHKWCALVIGSGVWPRKVLKIFLPENESGGSFDGNLRSCKAHGGRLATSSTPWISPCLTSLLLSGYTMSSCEDMVGTYIIKTVSNHAHIVIKHFMRSYCITTKLWLPMYKHQIMFSGWHRAHYNKIKQTIWLMPVCHQLPSGFTVPTLQIIA